MIICYSENFCFIRVPKAASTSCTGAILASGLVNPVTDYCSKSAEFNHGDVLESHRGLYYNRCMSLGISRLLEKKDRTHHSISQYRALNLIPDNMEIISTVRHPVCRFLSFVKFLYKDTDPNAAWDHWQECIRDQKFKNKSTVFGFQNAYNRMFKPQHWWWGPEATLWPVEHIDRCLSDFLTKHGVHHVPVHHRLSQRFLSNELSKHRKKQILDVYQQDFLFWEETISKDKFCKFKQPV